MQAVGRYNALVKHCENYERFPRGNLSDLFAQLVVIKGTLLSWDSMRSMQDGDTFLMWLVRRPLFNRMTFYVIAQTHDFMIKDQQGDNVLHHAVDGQNYVAVQMLCDHVRAAYSPKLYQQFLDSFNSEGAYALTFAVHHKNRPMLALLLQYGGRLLPNSGIINLLHESCGWDDNFEIFKMLIDELVAVSPTTNAMKYSHEFIDHYVNRSQTYCEHHQRNHTLWDYLETHQPVWRDYALSKLGHLVVA
jgi:ankyrin repeat protein